VAYSWTKTVSRPESDGREEMTRYTPARSAVLWNAHNAAFGLLRQRGVAVRRVRYEDFLADPRGVVIEHIVEQIEGLDLKKLARLKGSGVYEVEYAVFETDRAQSAGRVVKAEVRQNAAPAAD
jgi:hypothetical protein